MARMIPPIIGDDAAPGEKLIFARLASDPASEGWVALHSLDLAKHVRQVQGEADFVVVVPHRGIAVIEVKSHERVVRGGDGRWILGKNRPTPRSPFQQASGAMHSILEYLRSRRIDLRGTPVVHGVWFTHVRARHALPRSPEWQDWQLLDRDDLRLGVARAIARLLDRGREHLAERLPSIANTVPGPDETATAAIVSGLRPRLELGAGSADLRRERSSQLHAFLEEQYDALDAMENNLRVLFTGPAGCGKTFLALEAARRRAFLGGTGWLLCFNRALGAYLRHRSRGAPGVISGSLHGEMLRISGEIPPDGAGREFWQTELIDAAVERLLAGDLTRDYLIVDEAQDLCMPAYLDVLDLMVEGGLAGGRCLFFGDFERQALYRLDDGRPELAARIPGLPMFSLTANCRNLPRIGAAVEVLGGMEPGYRKFRRPDDGTHPRYYWYSDQRQQSRKLVQAVRDLRDDGFMMDEIVLLSARRTQSAAMLCQDPWLRPLLGDSETSTRGKVRCSTIHAFKGLESPAVVVTDVDKPDAPGFEALLYVGLSRATDRLSVLATKDALSDKVLGGGERL